MKKIVFLMVVGMLMLTSSCSKDAEISENSSNEFAPVTVSVVNDFSLSFEGFSPTRSVTPVAEYANVKAITLAFYDSNDAEICKLTQIRSDESTFTTFGHFSCSLRMGSYTMVVLAYGSENAMTLSSKNSATFTNDRVRETFVYSQAVNITSTEAVNLSATLSRVSSQLVVQSTDGRTENASYMTTTFSAGGQGVNPTTGFSTTNTGFSNRVDITCSVGATGGSVNNIFLNTDLQNMDVTIDVYDENNTLLTHKIASNVPLQRNRKTTLKGLLFSAVASSTFSVETDWLTGTEVTF